MPVRSQPRAFHPRRFIVSAVSEADTDDVARPYGDRRVVSGYGGKGTSYELTRSAWERERALP